VNVKNTSPTVSNKSDPVSGFQGIPRNMTCIARKLQDAGYRTALTGKWVSDPHMSSLELGSSTISASKR
jgi:arylsulfatase A-like enzyme